MSKNKSLGSSPIGLKSESKSMGFIPDLGVSVSKEEALKPSESKIRTNEQFNDKDGSSTSQQEQNKSPEKKIVSYNLEVDLIDRIKSIAEQKDLYYSSLVSRAVRSWIAENT